MIVDCAYCEAPVYTDFLSPAMCRRHYEVALIVSRLERRGDDVNLENVRAMLSRVGDAMIVRSEEVPALLRDVVGVSFTTRMISGFGL